MKKSMMLGIVIGIVAFMSGGYQAHATDVGGIIDTDTIWDLAGSPYIVTGSILVNSGVTLTIEAGVEVRFNGHYSLIIEGMIRSLGTQYNEILFTSNLTPQNQGDWEFIRLTNNVGSEFIGVIYEFSRYGLSIEGGANNTVSNSIFRNIQSTALDFNGSDNLLAHNNYIYNCGTGNYIVNIIYGGSVTFVNNTLENAVNGIQSNRLGYIINNNNFLGISNYSVYHCSAAGVIDGRYNYWGPETTAEMDIKGAAANIDKIYDFYDLPPCGRVDYAEWLNAPNPNAYPWMGTTPVNQSPVAKAGSDQAVFDTATLDGIASYDPDGSIDLYEWQLEYRGDSIHDKTAIGMNPTIPDLYSGFYDVHLTVTDNEGATSNDTAVLAAAGSCFCTTSTMHIESIVAGTIKSKIGKVTVTVFDDCGNPVPAVTVTGTFDLDFTGPGSGVTDANGVAVILTTAEVKKPSYKFCVDNVVKGTLPYEPNDNVETCETK